MKAQYGELSVWAEITAIIWKPRMRKLIFKQNQNVIKENISTFKNKKKTKKKQMKGPRRWWQFCKTTMNCVYSSKTKKKLQQKNWKINGAGEAHLKKTYTLPNPFGKRKDLHTIRHQTSLNMPQEAKLVNLIITGKWERIEKKEREKYLKDLTKW